MKRLLLQYVLDTDHLTDEDEIEEFGMEMARELFRQHMYSTESVRFVGFTDFDDLASADLGSPDQVRLEELTRLFDQAVDDSRS